MLIRAEGLEPKATVELFRNFEASVAPCGAVRRHVAPRTTSASMRRDQTRTKTD